MIRIEQGEIAGAPLEQVHATQAAKRREQRLRQRRARSQPRSIFVNFFFKQSQEENHNEVMPSPQFNVESPRQRPVVPAVMPIQLIQQFAVDQRQIEDAEEPADHQNEEVKEILLPAEARLSETQIEEEKKEEEVSPVAQLVAPDVEPDVAPDVEEDEEEEAEVADETPANSSNKKLTQSSKFVDPLKIVKHDTILLSQDQAGEHLGFKLGAPTNLEALLEQTKKERQLQWETHQKSKLPKRRQSSLQRAAQEWKARGEEAVLPDKHDVLEVVRKRHVMLGLQPRGYNYPELLCTPSLDQEFIQLAQRKQIHFQSTEQQGDRVPS